MERTKGQFDCLLVNSTVFRFVLLAADKPSLACDSDLFRQLSVEFPDLVPLKLFVSLRFSLSLVFSSDAVWLLSYTSILKILNSLSRLEWYCLMLNNCIFGFMVKLRIQKASFTGYLYITWKNFGLQGCVKFRKEFYFLDVRSECWEFHDEKRSLFYAIQYRFHRKLKFLALAGIWQHVTVMAEIFVVTEMNESIKLGCSILIYCWMRNIELLHWRYEFILILLT